MIHLYHGDGKGKTTAACGLALRAAGSGLRVLFVQFLKDGRSSEIVPLSSIPGITVLRPELYFGWYRQMTEEQKARLTEYNGSVMQKIADAAPDYDMIILDEAIPAFRYGLLENEAFLAFLRKEKSSREIVMTGREPACELRELADYITQMKKEKHPFDRGVPARKGIEY